NLIRYPRQVHDALLHRNLDALAFAGELPLVERAEDPERTLDPGAAVTDVDAGTGRRRVRRSGHRDRPARGRRARIQTRTGRVRPVGCEAFDLRVHDARVDRTHRIVTETHPLDGPRAEVFDEHVGFDDQLAQQFAAALVLEVDGRAALVGVEQQK